MKLRTPLVPMIAGIAAVIGLHLAASRSLTRTFGQVRGMAAVTLASCALYLVILKLYKND